MKPSDEATSGNSASGSWIHFGVERRFAWNGAEVESGTVGRTMDGEVGESELKTLWFATSNNRLKCFKKSAPRMGTATGASWKGHSNLLSPNRRGIIREPEQESKEPSAVSNLTPDEVEEERGAGNTDTDAPESIRNLHELSESCK